MKARFAFLGAAMLAAGLVACGSGGGGSTPPPTTAPTSSPTPPTSVTIVLAASPTTAPLPGSASGTLSIPAGSGTLTVVGTKTNPSPVPVIQLANRAHIDASGGNTAVEYFTATATGGPVSMTGIPGFSVVLPAGAPSGTYFVAYYSVPGQVTPGPQAPAWVSSTSTGGTPSGGSVAVPATTTPAITLQSGQSLYLAVYVGGFIPPINISGCVGVNLATKHGGTAPALIGSHPITSGDAYNYAGTLAQAITRSQPCPQPTATANANVTVAVTMGTNVENSIETDAYATNSTTLTTAANVSLVSGKYLESSEHSTDLNGNAITTNYGAHPLQFGQLPELAGNTWSNSTPATVNETLADGTTILRNYSSGGAYVETDTFPGGTGTNVITVNPDASGSYALSAASGPTVTVGAPTGGNVKISIGTSSLTVPVWFPTNPINLYSDVTHDLGPSGSLPGGCTFTYPQGTPEHIARTIQIVDPVVGYTETETFDSYDIVGYVGGVTLGPVCTKISDVQNQYYDYSLTTTYGLYFSLNAQPVITNSINEQISLSNSGLIANRVGRNAQQAFNAQLVARQAGITFARALQRSQQLSSMAHAIIQNGGLR